MSFPEMDKLSIAIAALLYVVINFFWYSKWLFGKHQSEWLHTKGKNLQHMILIRSIPDLLRGLVIAFFLAFFYAHLNATSVIDGMCIGFCIWLGFVATTQIGSVIWFKQPLKVFFIQTGSKLVSYLVMGGIIGA